MCLFGEIVRVQGLCLDSRLHGAAVATAVVLSRRKDMVSKLGQVTGPFFFSSSPPPLFGGSWQMMKGSPLTGRIILVSCCWLGAIVGWSLVHQWETPAIVADYNKSDRQ